MEWKNESGGDAFDEDLERFLRTSRFGEDVCGDPAMVAGRVRAEKHRRDRAFYGTACAAAAVLLSAGLWFGLGADGGGVAAGEQAEDEVYVEVHLLEEAMQGAEGLFDEDVLDTLDYLLGG